MPLPSAFPPPFHVSFVDKLSTTALEGGFMDKRNSWREQEQLLVERWNAAAGRFREVQAAISSQSSGKGELAPDEENVLKAKAARAELETMRKQSARLKAEFSAAIAAAFS